MMLDFVYTVQIEFAFQLLGTFDQRLFLIKNIKLKIIQLLFSYFYIVRFNFKDCFFFKCFLCCVTCNIFITVENIYVVIKITLKINF